MICSKCKKIIVDGSRFCEFCGTPVESATPARPETPQYIDPLAVPEVKEESTPVSVPPLPKFSEVVGQTIKFGQAATEKIGSAVETVKKQVPANSPVKPVVKGQEDEGAVSNRYTGQNYMSDKNMWSWLKRDSKRQQFFTETVSAETEESYMESLQKKLDENIVPAKIERREVYWDNSTLKQMIYQVIPDTKVVNPVAYLIQFNQVGKFTYIEEKTFILPPDLPREPGEFRPVKDGGPEMRFYAMIAGVAFILGIILPGSLKAVCFIVAAVCGFLAYRALNAGSEDRAHNERVRREMEAWNSAWSNWETSIFAHSFQEDINGRLSRIYDSVFGCIKQVNEEKFGDKAVTEMAESTSMSELKSMISERKKEYK